MDYLIPSLATPVDNVRSAFARPEVFATFPHLLAGWILAPGPRTLSEVRQATGRAATHHRDTAYSFFASAKWNWDDLGHLLLLAVVARLVPTGAVRIVVDDTLCHKRGARVAFGGFFLDAVTATKKKKNVRFGVNWVVVGLRVHLPFRPDRSFVLPVLWRAYRKKGTPGHQTRTALAGERARRIATWLPDRDCWRVGDRASLNGTVRADRPKNLRMIGPLRWNAALHRPPAVRQPGQKGRPKVLGERLPTPAEMTEDAKAFRATRITADIGGTTRRLRVRVVRDVVWPAGSKTERMTVVLVRDVAGEWRDEVLAATGGGVSASFVIGGYGRRWGIAVAFAESKQLLGLHDPWGRTGPSVERAHPRAWFVQTLTVVWYVETGKDGSAVTRDRPWYRSKAGVSFADMLGGLRLQQWELRFSRESADGQSPQEILDSLKHWLAAVR